MRRKYDALLDDHLLDTCIVNDQLDLDGARATWRAFAAAIDAIG